jgi:hypothetical protein
MLIRAGYEIKLETATATPMLAMLAMLAMLSIHHGRRICKRRTRSRPTPSSRSIIMRTISAISAPG